MADWGHNVIDRAIPCRGINLKDDEASLEPGEVLELDNYRVDSVALKTREGSSRLNANSFAAANGVQGGLRAVFSDGSAKFLVAANSTLSTVSDAGAVAALTLPSNHTMTDAPTLMEMFQDKALVLAQGDKLLAYDGTNDPFVPETLSPHLIKTIYSFESTTGWSDDSATQSYAGSVSFSLDTHHHTEQSGAIEFTTGSGSSKCRAKYTLAANSYFGAFSDGTTFSDPDYVSLDVYCSAITNITEIEIFLYNAAYNGYYRANLKTNAVDGWPTEQVSSSFTIRIRKRDFTHGGTSPSWSDIGVIALDITYSSAATVTLDWLRLERSGPVADPMHVLVSRCNSQEGWTGCLFLQNSGGTAPYFTPREGNSAIRLTDANSNATLTANKNLAYFPDGTAVDANDSLAFWMCKSANVAESNLTIRFTTSANNYYQYTGVLGCGVQPGWTQHLLPLSSFSSTGTPSWANITETKLTKVNANTADLYVDKMEILPLRDSIVILSVDQTDLGAFSANLTVPTANNVLSWNSAQKKGQYGPQSLKIVSGKGSATTATWTWSDANGKNLGVYASNMTSLTTDALSFWFYVESKLSTLASVTLDVDGSANGTAWTRYFTYTMNSREIEAKKRKYRDFWVEFTAKKRDFTSIPAANGTAPVWTGSRGVRITVNSTAKKSATIYVDGLTMTRGGTLTGSFQYRATYVNWRNVESAPSLPSSPMDHIEDLDVYVSAIPTQGNSSSSLVKARRLYRMGGASSEWKLVAQLSGNDQTTYLDDTPEEYLGDPMKDYQNITFRAYTMTKWGNRVVLGNLIDPSGYAYASGYVVSQPHSYEVFDERGVIEVAPLDGEELMAVLPFEDKLHLLKENSHWIHDEESGIPKQLHGEYGLAAPMAWTVAGNALYYWSKPYGIIRWDGVQHERFGLKQAKPLLDTVPTACVSKVRMAYFDEHLLIAYTPSGGTYNTKILWCYLPAGIWGTFSGMNAGCWIPKRSTGTLYFGQANAGYVVQALTGDTDPGGASITSTLQSRSVAYEMPEITKDGHRLYLNGKKLTSSDANLTIQLYHDCKPWGPSWAANTAYSVGEFISPTTYANRVYKCTVAGTSHVATEPTWPTTLGETVSDGTVTWELAAQFTGFSFDSLYNKHERVTLPSPEQHKFYLGYKITASARHVLRTATLTAVNLEAR